MILSHRMRAYIVAVALAAAVTVLPASAQPGQRGALQNEIDRITRGFDGRVGVCVQDSAAAACVNGTQRFPLQSVMKLLVGIATMDAVDRRGWKLDEQVVVRKQDLSLAVQPLAKLVGDDGIPNHD